MDLGRRLERDLHPGLFRQLALEVPPGVDDRAVLDHVDRVDGRRPVHPAVDPAHRGVVLPRSHAGAVQCRFEEDSFAGRGVGGAIAQGAEDRVRVVVRRDDGSQAAQLAVADP